MWVRFNSSESAHTQLQRDVHAGVARISDRMASAVFDAAGGEACGAGHGRYVPPIPHPADNPYIGCRGPRGSYIGPPRSADKPPAILSRRMPEAGPAEMWEAGCPAREAWVLGAPDQNFGFSGRPAGLSPPPAGWCAEPESVPLSTGCLPPQPADLPDPQASVQAQIDAEAAGVV